MRFQIMTLGALGVAALLGACVVEGPPMRPGPGPGPGFPPPGDRICTREYDPVCAERGRDRETFSNACEARAAGYRIIRDGQCRRGSGGYMPTPEPGPGRPGGPGGPGPGPGYPPPGPPPGPGGGLSCTMQYDPVCARRGRDVRTFGNACEAGRSGYDVMSRGECRR